VPGPREACSLLGRRNVEVHPIVPLFQGMGLEFAIMSYAGRLSICAAADPHLVPDAADIPGHLGAALAELREAVAVEPARPAASGPPEGPRVGDLMTADVVTIGAYESLGRAHAIMRRRRIRHLPVVADDGRLIGLVTHRDLLAAGPSSLEIPAEADRLRVLERARAGDVMETHLSVTVPGAPAAEAGARMIRHKIGCLPVIEPDGRLAGIVTEEDLLRWATSQLARAS
jgi:CBS domain-containing protein